VNVVWVLIVIGFADEPAHVQPIEFEDAKECQAAIAAIKNGIVGSNYFRVVCVKKTSREPT
jgi:hypothetical protein